MEALFFGGLGQGAGDGGVFDFGDGAAFIADEELHVVMVVLGVAAGDEGIQLFELVDQPVFDQEIQGAIDRWRHGGFTDRFQLIEQLVSGQRTRRFQDQGQNGAAQGGELGAVCGAKFFRFRQCLVKRWTLYRVRWATRLNHSKPSLTFLWRDG